MADIHPTAIVHERARLGQGNSIGAYSIIGADVVIGENNRVGPHVVIEGHTSIGDGNQIFQFASVGAAPQDLKFRGEASTLTIGSRNIIREFVTLQPGTKGGGMKTVIGDENLFMANSHVGHDGIIGNGNVFANSAAIAGHVTIGNNIIVGGLAGIHQFVRLGDGVILGAGSMVSQDVPPFCMAQGDRAHLAGLNVIGLERRGVQPEQIQQLKKIYRALFLGKGVLSGRITEARSRAVDFPLGEALVTFVESSTRGVTAPRSKRVMSDE